METCQEYIVASIGTLKAGAALMPMTLDSPESLLRAIVAGSRPKVVVTKSRYLPKLDGLAVLLLSDYVLINCLAKMSA